MYAHGFLCGVALTLLAVTVALLIGEAVLKRKIRDMKKRTVREAVEVVRCKDCKRWFGNWYIEGHTEWHGHCHNDDTPVGRWESDFCSYGERKDNG